MKLLDTIELLDLRVLNFFHSVQSKGNDLFFSFITWFGSLWTIVPLFGFLIFLLIKNNLSFIVFPLIVGFLGTVTTTYALKYSIDRKRPDVYEVIGELPEDPSFPSAHTSQVFIFVFLIIILFFYLDLQLKYWISFGLVSLASLVAISRIYLQVHYISDVVTGLLVSCFWALAAVYLLYR